MNEQLFAGAWRLLSFEMIDADGQTKYPFGQNPLGYLIYTSNGYMAVSYMPAERQNFAVDDSMGGSIEEKAAAMESYRSYCGRYSVQEDRVTHHVEVGLFPNWKGRAIVRRYQFEDNRLTLTTLPTLYAGKQQTARLVWERAE